MSPTGWLNYLLLLRDKMSSQAAGQTEILMIRSTIYRPARIFIWWSPWAVIIKMTMCSPVCPSLITVSHPAPNPETESLKTDYSPFAFTGHILQKYWHGYRPIHNFPGPWAGKTGVPRISKRPVLATWEDPSIDPDTSNSMITGLENEIIFFGGISTNALY